jgi:hypothetical protein
MMSARMKMRRYIFGARKEYRGFREVMQYPRVVYAQAEKKAGPRMSLEGERDRAVGVAISRIGQGGMNQDDSLRD